MFFVVLISVMLLPCYLGFPLLHLVPIIMLSRMLFSIIALLSHRELFIGALLLILTFLPFPLSNPLTFKIPYMLLFRAILFLSFMALLMPLMLQIAPAVWSLVLSSPSVEVLLPTSLNYKALFLPVVLKLNSLLLFMLPRQLSTYAPSFRSSMSLVRNPPRSTSTIGPPLP